MSNEATQPIDDGGPAFPIPVAAVNNVHGEPVTLDSGMGGMTLRDWFAGQAVPGLIEGYDFEMREKAVKDKVAFRTGFDDNPHGDSESTWASQLADEAYIIADAMIAARKGRP